MTVATHKTEEDQRHHHGQIVAITLDGNLTKIADGVYKVSEFKAKFGIPAEYELDLVVHGEFQPLNPERSIHIQGHEVLVSHVPQGGSS